MILDAVEAAETAKAVAEDWTLEALVAAVEAIETDEKTAAAVA